ncbi:MAG TPA: glycosyltransferase [Propionibacteriaceae bacterium]
MLAGDPARRLIEEAGETVLDESAALAGETGSAEETAEEFSLNLVAYVRRAAGAWRRTVAAFAQVIAESRYDLVIGDETYEIAAALARRPALKRAPFVMIYDFVGIDAMTRNPVEHLVAYLWNRAWCGRPVGSAAGGRGPGCIHWRAGGRARPSIRLRAAESPGVRPLLLLVRRIRPGLRPRRLCRPRSVRGALGYDERPLVVCSVGGTAVGADLLRLCAEAYPHLVASVLDAQMVLVCGPRLDPATVPAPNGVQARGYVPRLFEHLAACDAAVVQSGGTTTLELTALRRPFVYVPLQGHFEQQLTVAPRLIRHSAGYRLDFARARPQALADTIAGLLDSEPTWPPIRTDGARRPPS